MLCSTSNIWAPILAPINQKKCSDGRSASGVITWRECCQFGCERRLLSARALRICDLSEWEEAMADKNEKGRGAQSDDLSKNREGLGSAGSSSGSSGRSGSSAGSSGGSSGGSGGGSHGSTGGSGSSSGSTEK